MMGPSKIQPFLLESEFGVDHWTQENWQGVGLSTVAFLLALVVVIWISKPKKSDGDSKP